MALKHDAEDSSGSDKAISGIPSKEYLLPTMDCSGRAQVWGAPSPMAPTVLKMHTAPTTAGAHFLFYGLFNADFPTVYSEAHIHHHYMGYFLKNSVSTDRQVYLLSQNL